MGLVEGDVISGEALWEEDAAGGPLDHKEGARVMVLSLLY